MKRSVSSALFGLTLATAAAGGAWAQPAAAPTTSPDMAAPDDLGAPRDGAPVGETPEAAPAGMSIKTPIAAIAASPQGRAVLDRDLPGLLQRPEFTMFKGMSPATLAGLSHGRINQAKMNRLQTDLVKVSLASAAPTMRTHSIFTRSGQAVGRVSKAVYERVVLVIASL